MKERVEMFREWLIEGPPNAFWLSGFFFPQGFMTGCLQTHARLHKIPIDKLAFGFEILKEENLEDFPEAPEEGMYIYGMYMDGARCNRDEILLTISSHPFCMTACLACTSFRRSTTSLIPTS